jgi:hypothetical protein
MSNTVQPNSTAVGVFQAQFGAPPGSQDAKAECEKWQRLCDELLADRERLRADRERLRAEVERRRLDEMCKHYKLNLTMEQVYAQVDRESSIEQVIAELERELEAEKKV